LTPAYPAAVISFITVAELRYGAMLAGWGLGRLTRLDHELARAETVWPGPNLTET
jgi:predicted nucleic acid-binding protein